MAWAGAGNITTVTGEKYSSSNTVSGTLGVRWREGYGVRAFLSCDWTFTPLRQPVTPIVSGAYWSWVTAESSEWPLETFASLRNSLYSLRPFSLSTGKKIMETSEWPYSLLKIGFYHEVTSLPSRTLGSTRLVTCVLRARRSLERRAVRSLILFLHLRFGNLHSS